MHKFAQIFSAISVDAFSVRVYLAHQIEPGSLKTSRLNLEGAASLTASCVARLNREVPNKRVGLDVSGNLKP
jgi:hypothetical protein